MKMKTKLQPLTGSTQQTVSISVSTASSSKSIRIGFTDPRLTAYGGLAFWSAFLHKRRVRQQVQAVLPHAPTSPNAYAPTDVALGFLGGILAGADKLSRVAYLQHDPAIAQVLGIEAIAVWSRAHGRGTLKLAVPKRWRPWWLKVIEKLNSLLPPLNCDAVENHAV